MKSVLFFLSLFVVGIALPLGVYGDCPPDDPGCSVDGATPSAESEAPPAEPARVPAVESPAPVGRSSVMVIVPPSDFPPVASGRTIALRGEVARLDNRISKEELRMYVGTGDRNPTDEEVHQYLLKKTRGPDRLTASGEETSLIAQLDELSRKRNELINSLGEDRAAQRDAIRGLETTLRSPSLLPDVRSALEGRLEQSQKEIKKLEEEWHAQQAREEVFITDFIPYCN